MILIILLLLLVSQAITIFNKNKLVVYNAVFLSGILFMVVSNTLYMKTLTNVSVPYTTVSGAILDFIGKMFSPTISHIRKMSLFGECIIFLLFIIIAGKALKKNIWFYILSFFVFCVYIYCSLPETLFHIYLHINSKEPAQVHTAKIMLEVMKNLKYITIMYFAVIPYFACIYKYKRTILLVKKHSMIKVMIVVVIEQIVLLLLVNLRIINDFTRTSYDIFYMKNIPEVYTVKVTILIWLILLVIAASTIAANINLNSKYFSKMSVSNMYRFSKFERNIKMILHTYKNLFFVITQLSDCKMYDEELSKQSAENINSIHDISENALYGITRQIKMLSDLEIDLETFEMPELIEQSQRMLLEEEKKLIKTVYYTQETRINSDIYCLADAICNILKNAVDALTETEEPQIVVSVDYEDKWYVIEIADNGSGIDKKKIKEIFKPLVSYKKGSNNWGIGLYYSYKVINALNGYLFVQSNEGEYTKFYINLPSNIRNGRKLRE